MPKSKLMLIFPEPPPASQYQEPGAEEEDGGGEGDWWGLGQAGVQHQSFPIVNG